jgi:hypothetical protein
MNVIQDGRGKGYSAGVDSLNRALVKSVSQSRVSDISKREGQAFLIASDFISLTTTASFNGIIYLENTSDLDLYIGKIRTCSDTSGNVQCRLIRNPSTGTLISDANDADQLPSNFGSNEAFGGFAYTASGDGKTVTDGTNESQFINHSPGHSIQEYEGAIILPKSSSLALVAKPSVALTFCAEIQCWFEGEE